MSPITRQAVFIDVYITAFPPGDPKYVASVAQLSDCVRYGNTETEAEANAIIAFRAITNSHIRNGTDIPWRASKPPPADAVVRQSYLRLGPAPEARWYDLALGGMLWLGGWCLVHGIHLIERIGGWIVDRIRGKKGEK